MHACQMRARSRGQPRSSIERHGVRSAWQPSQRTDRLSWGDSRDALTRLTKQMSAVRNRPRPPVQRPLADHGEGPLTVVSDGSRSLRPMQPQQPVHASHRFPTTLVGDVGVDVHRDGDLRVTEDLHRDARRHTCGEQERGARVPGVVEPDHTEPGILGHARERREGFSTSSRALPPRQRGVARPGEGWMG